MLLQPFREVVAAIGTAKKMNTLLRAQGVQGIIFNASHLMHDGAYVECRYMWSSDMTILWHRDHDVWKNDYVAKVDFFNFLEALSKEMFVWPPIPDMVHVSKPFDHLEKIYPLLVHRYPIVYPETRPYSNEPISSHRMYKRDGSCNMRHVLPGRKNPRPQIESDIAQNGTRWRWISQERIPSLANAGQIRIFYSAGHITHIVQTTRVGSSRVGCPVSSVLYPMEMKYVYRILRGP